MVNERDKSGDFRVGDVVGGRYELRRELGRGAEGLVFEARHRFTQRITAIKFVSPGPSSQLATRNARLLREGRALAAVRHAGVVEVLDGGLTETGSPFLVLEKLDGRTLEGLIAARGKLSPEDSVAVGLQLCESLDALHRAGVVHRDLKPGNIFVVKDRDGVERLKLVDFGIAQLAGQDGDKLTGIGALIGTPAYMSPEQLLALEVDERADVYSLGVTLFECLTSRVPYDGNYQSVLLQACSESLPVPKVTDHVPDLPKVLSDVVDHAIARDPSQRFSSAMELGRALHAALPSAGPRTFFLGPPAVPRFGPARAQKAADPRRRFARANFVTPVQIAHATGTLDGRSEDISEMGMLVICRDPCEPGGIATVRFAPPIDGRVVTCQATVRWVRAARPSEPQGPRAIGLEFGELPASARASIARYVGLMGDGPEAPR